MRSFAHRRAKEEAEVANLRACASRAGSVAVDALDLFKGWVRNNEHLLVWFQASYVLTKKGFDRSPRLDSRYLAERVPRSA